MINRLFKSGIVTTCLGILMMGGAVYMYMNESFSTTEAGELGALGLIFLRSKDSLIGLTPKEEKKEAK